MNTPTLPTPIFQQSKSPSDSGVAQCEPKKSFGTLRSSTGGETRPLPFELPLGTCESKRGKLSATSKPNPKVVLEELRTFAVYSEEKGGLVATRQRRANSQGVGELLGHRAANGYFTLYLAQQSFLIHHLVWLWHHGEWPPQEIDHIDRDRWNNRIGNLRLCHSREVNGRNASKKSNNTSGYNGVSFHKASGKWMARLNAPHQIYLGLHNTAEDANEAVKQYQDAHPELGFSKEHGQDLKQPDQRSNERQKSAIKNRITYTAPLAVDLTKVKYK